MNDLGPNRRARAYLSWLFEPTDPYPRDLLVGANPVTALQRLADANLTATQLRAEVRSTPHHLLWDTFVEAITKAHRAGIRVVVPEDDEWPTDVADLAASPPRTDGEQIPGLLCLWVRGHRPIADTLRRSLTVTGARAATDYGAHVAAQLGHDLTGAGWTVVNAGAFGIDSAALRGTLAHEGTPVVVQPGGLDSLHPASNSMLFDRVAETGLQISAWPPGALPNRTRPAANANLLAQLTRGTVIVEAALASRALRPLHRAISLGRPAMLVPGPVTSSMSAGCHDALRHWPQARLVTGAADIINELDIATRPGTSRDG
ncbi:DNA-processing protein DprA [Micromonospora sp. WMMD1082]|uniref:DNA-processing protein DprA n=1 Tax=Micromonospora sp. WMMD1082 TaxID=3016104 RepID=UPI0024171E75|nr:DNA-processing protein DprA [Micromonospora sp. WMMD1082]MDG4795033.1 DNA-processing protein DprA [Micromonospora sp. WMMD1082]